MEMFINLFIIYLIGSIFGFILEVLYRRFFSTNKWINPGFLTGPYQPLYGFGVLILYLISLLNIHIIYKLLIIVTSLTLLEYITGLIFIKLLNIKLWDYSNTKYNISGIITPVFSLYWLILGSLYIYLINPLIINILNNINYNNLLLIFSLGIIFAIILIDFLHNINFARKIKKILSVTKEYIHYEKFKLYNKLENNKLFKRGLLDSLKNNINEFLEKFKDNKKWEFLTFLFIIYFFI